MEQRRIIWFAIAFSTVIYAVIAYTQSPNPEGTFDESLKDPFVYVLYALALVTFVAALIIPGLLRRVPAQTRLILALALFEACAVYGFMASFLKHDWRLYLAPWAIAVIGFVKVFPASSTSPEVQ